MEGLEHCDVPLAHTRSPDQIAACIAEEAVGWRLEDVGEPLSDSLGIGQRADDIRPGRKPDCATSQAEVQRSTSLVVGDSRDLPAAQDPPTQLGLVGEDRELVDVVED